MARSLYACSTSLENTPVGTDTTSTTVSCQSETMKNLQQDQTRTGTGQLRYLDRQQRGTKGLRAGGPNGAEVCRRSDDWQST